MKYKEIEVEGRGPRYLRSENLNKIGKGDKVKALIKLRCGNMEGANKYWLEESHWGCTFCKEGRDNVEHQVKECQIIRERLKELGEDEGRIIQRIWEENLDEVK